MPNALALYDATGLIAKADKLLCELDRAETVEAIVAVEAKADALVGLAKRLGVELGVINAAVDTWLQSLWELGEKLPPAKQAQCDAGGDKSAVEKLHSASQRWRDRKRFARKLRRGVAKRSDITDYVIAATAADKIGTLAGCLGIGPHVAENAGDIEWFSRAEIVDAARGLMGGIDLDPASTKEANAIVKARRFFTVKEDGLTQPWRGRVWMNPPYKQPLVSQFCAHLVQSVQSGEVPQACALLNNATETAFFQELAAVAACICFPAGRSSFWHPRKQSAPLQGQAVLYCGKKKRAFFEAFSAFGFCAEVMR